ncbi:hypothetical protein [uncultured Fibrobacter sp.]|uniref:hypothetical protein n=1 Tax=uncultured Fibrobacter sp. TaxID=261512 RepID=UPI00260863F3|nr:hypothetical protein [uncultured Fibrobacter sp.]
MKSFLSSAMLSVVVATTMMFAACGSDDNSSNVEREEGSSSSEESSSSVKEKSSSSVAELPEGDRAATLEDLSKNYSLGKMFGTEVFLATGTKTGVFSIWIPDVSWMAIRSEFKDGILEYGETHGSFMGVDSSLADSMKAFFQKGGSFHFIVNSDKELQYSLNDDDYVTVKKVDVKASTNWESDGSNLKGVKLACTKDKVTKNIMFYEGRYVVEESAGDSSMWMAGYYDIQRSHLLMLPVFFNKTAYSLESGMLKSDYSKLVMDTGDEYSCKKSTFKSESIDPEKIAGEWFADDDGYDWTLMLDANGDYSVVAMDGANPVEKKTGSWDIYGDVLLLNNAKCMKPSSCAGAVKGAISGFDAKKGFNFDHDDVQEPLVPKTWTLPLYE